MWCTQVVPLSSISMAENRVSSRSGSWRMARKRGSHSSSGAKGTPAISGVRPKWWWPLVRPGIATMPGPPTRGRCSRPRRISARGPISATRPASTRIAAPSSTIIAPAASRPRRTWPASTIRSGPGLGVEPGLGSGAGGTAGMAASWIEARRTRTARVRAFHARGRAVHGRRARRGPPPGPTVKPRRPTRPPGEAAPSAGAARKPPPPRRPRRQLAPGQGLLRRATVSRL